MNDRSLEEIYKDRNESIEKLYGKSIEELIYESLYELKKGE